MLAHIGIDLGFGENGLAPVDASVFMSPLADGKILAVGPSEVVRLNADGSIDQTFFDEGGAQAKLGKMNWLAGSAVISGQRVYVGGILESRDPSAAVRSEVTFVRALNLADGSIDESFGAGGFATAHITPVVAGSTPSSIRGPDLALLPGGGLVFTVTHEARDEDHWAITMYKYEPTGRFDLSFGGSGEVIVRAERFASVTSIATDASGRIFVLDDGGDFDAARLSRYLPDGTLDPTFGDDGRTRAEFEYFPSNGEMRIQPDGKVLIPINNSGEPNDYFTIVRLSPDGSLDKKEVILRRIEQGGRFRPALDASGRIIVSVDKALLRLKPDLTLDPTFVDDGIALLPDGFAGGTVLLDDAGGFLVANNDGVARYIETARVGLGSDGILRVEGDDGDDTVTARLDGQLLNIACNGQMFTFRAASVLSLNINLRGGQRNGVDVELDIPVKVSTFATINSVDIVGDANAIVDSGPNTVIVTGDGDDQITFQGDATVISNGGDDQIVTFNAPGYRFEIDTGAGDDRIHINSGIGIVYAGDGDDLIMDTDASNGSAEVDSLFGENGNDTIIADAGPDFISGGPSLDSLDGGGGDDTIVDLSTPDLGDINVPGFALSGGALIFTGSMADDQISIWADDEDLVIWIRGELYSLPLASVTTIKLYGNGGNDLLKLNPGLNFRVTLDGGGGADELIGSGGPDTLYGGSGDDLLFGNAGDDYLDGGAGGDLLRGNDGSDFLSYSKRTADLDISFDDIANDGEADEGDLVASDIEWILCGSGDDRVVGNDGVQIVHGFAGNDTLIGGAGGDALSGDEGDDYLEGGAGHDLLTGGGGADQLFGLSGNDTMDPGGDLLRDTVRGGTGNDRAHVDADTDDVLDVEGLTFR
jgi:uncharacterized delta-60 repeat protein